MQSDQSSIAILYAREFRTLRRYVRRTIASSWDAQDIVQDAYVRLLTRPANSPSLENPRAFLFVVAAHLALDRLRHLRRSERLFVGLAHDAAPEIGESDADADADADGDVSAGAASVACLGSRLEDEADAAMRFRQLLSSLKGLGSDCHQAFVMHKIKELSYAEVACHMGITVSMVEKHLSKALHYLGIGRQSLAERRSQR